jgi:hypothetical protein
MHGTSGGTSPVEARPSVTALLELEVSEGDRALLREAVELTGLETPSQVLRVALLELVERRRFQNLVSELGE